MNELYDKYPLLEFYVSQFSEEEEKEYVEMYKIDAKNKQSHQTLLSLREFGMLGILSSLNYPENTFVVDNGEVEKFNRDPNLETKERVVMKSNLSLFSLSFIYGIGHAYLLPVLEANPKVLHLNIKRDNGDDYMTLEDIAEQLDKEALEMVTAETKALKLKIELKLLKGDEDATEEEQEIKKLERMYENFDTLNGQGNSRVKTLKYLINEINTTNKS